MLATTSWSARPRFRFTPKNRHRQLDRPRRKSTRSGHPITSSARTCAGSFGQPRFPKALDQQLRVRLAAPGDPRAYGKPGIKLKQTHRRLTRLGVAFEVSESGRETAVSRRIGEVLAKDFLPCGNGRVKAPKLNKGIPHPGKQPI